MSLDIDTVLDRRHLRRKLSFWRIGTFIAVAIAILAALQAAGAFKGAGGYGDHIARVAVTGMITEDRKLLKLLADIEKDEKVKGLILTIDSPGGTTVGGEAIFEAVRRIADKKPVSASVGTLAASAGYMIATASDHIVARRSSIVGSIGVIFQYPQAKELLDKIGVSIDEIKSSPLKAEPSPFHTPPPEAKAAIKELIDDSYNWFVDLVTDRRPLNRAQVLKLADGRIYSGDRGVKEKLIDAIGGEEVAKKWLVTEKGLSEDLKVLEWKPPQDRRGFLFSAQFLNWLTGSASNKDGLNVNHLPAVLPKRLFLDGLLSVWHGN
jgi:protease-4